MKKKLTLLMVAFLTLTAFAATMAIKKVTDVPAAVTGDFHWEEATSIAAGDVVLIAVDNGNVTKELGGLSTTATVYGVATDYTGTPAGLYPLTVEAGSTTRTFAFKNGDTYLNWTSGNSLTAGETKDANASWTVTFADGKASIVNTADNTRNLMYNAGSPRFACYNIPTRRQ